MDNQTKSPISEIGKLLEIMSTLRGPSGCPWDRKQTPDSLKPYLLEEVYELLEALDENNWHNIRDELGDLLLQIVFLSQIFHEEGKFNFSDVAASINTKMVRRHPHVFANENPRDHAQNWERIKQEERNRSGQSEKLKDRIPQALPALKKAKKVAKKTETKSSEILIENSIDLLRILKQSLEDDNNQTTTDQSKTLARILYDLAALSTNIGVDAEDLLRKETDEIIRLIDD